jgi:outer membrane protein OmpA-like peptidoglycan-associated protein
MVWKLESVEGFGGVARIQISFTPRQSVGANTLTFLQTVLETGSPLKMDVVWRKGETVPFYGAEWDPTAKRWGPGPQAEGYRNEPSTGSGTAHMFDAPMVFSRGHEKLFEAVPVVAETGETLGALRWGVADGGTKLFGARDADCTEAPSAEFGAAVEKYYAAPAEVGPDPQRVERFDAILDGFAPDDATLTEKHEAQLDPVAAKVNGDPDLLVELGGFADANEKDPVGVSEKRVQAVEDYLVGEGVARARFSLAQASTRAYGASWARYPPSGTESRNRRVQVFVFHPTEQQRQRASGGAAPAAGARSGSGR